MPSSSIIGWVQVGPDRVRRGKIRKTRNNRASWRMFGVCNF